MKVFTYSHGRTPLLKSWCFHSVYLSFPFHPLLRFPLINMATLHIIWKEVPSQFFLRTLQWQPAASATEYSCGDDRDSGWLCLSNQQLLQWSFLCICLYLSLRPLRTLKGLYIKTTTTAYRPSSNLCISIPTLDDQILSLSLSVSLSLNLSLFSLSFSSAIQAKSRWAGATFCHACPMATSCITCASFFG